MKRFTPKILIKYLIKEFSLSLIIFIAIFSSLIILFTFVEEVVFFKGKDINNNFFLKVFILTLIKSPTLILNFMPFIFLFSGILFFVKFMKNNEITPMRLSGFSNEFIALVPGIFSFFLGLIFICIVSPITSTLSKYYETGKNRYSDNDNLLIMSDTGIWIKESSKNIKYIIRADKISDQDFSTLKNLSIYVFKNNFFSKRIDAEQVKIDGYKWKIKNGTNITENKSEKLRNFVFNSDVDINKLKNYFNNSDVFSIWNINNELKEIRKRGYYGQELVIKLNKYLSLPFMLFSMIILASLFTIKMKVALNNSIYIFLAIIAGILIYFLSDLSIALGKNGKIPLVLSVWIPVILIITLTFYTLLQNDD